MPRRCDPRRVAPFVAKHQVWLQRTMAQAQRQNSLRQDYAQRLPASIQLPAVEEHWVVAYPLLKDGAHVRDAVLTQQRLVVETCDSTQVQQRLQHWLHAHARHHLPRWLSRLSHEFRLSYGACSVRAQKTRWGSCSARGRISLNRNLLFLPPHLTRYVLIHELCHTVHLNHSPRYWVLVGRMDPRFRQWEAELKTADWHIPLWAMPS